MTSRLIPSLLAGACLLFSCLAEDELDTDVDFRSKEEACNNGNGQKNGLDCDGDGFKKKDECNDDDASVYPGAPDEACNGIDNDCDGEIDEDFVEADTKCGDKACLQVGVLICVDGEEIDTCEPVACDTCQDACIEAAGTPDACKKDPEGKLCAATMKEIAAQCEDECACELTCEKKADAVYKQCVHDGKDPLVCEKHANEVEKKCRATCTNEKEKQDDDEKKLPDEEEKKGG